MANRVDGLLARKIAGGVLMVGIIAVLAAWPGMSAQTYFKTGQNVAPVFEGWEQNPDGSFNLVFGYFNRNFDEHLDVPVGPDNTLEPGGPDQGQPSHFLPLRNRFLFRVRVPKDFGKKEVVWTLTTRGKTEQAYGTLKPDYYMDDIVIMNDTGAGGSGGGGNHINGNKPPTLKVEGDKTRTAMVGQPVTLTAMATDDGVPKRRVIHNGESGRSIPAAKKGAPPTVLTDLPTKIGSRCCSDSASGLRLAWFVYRGANNVTYDPPQFEVWEDYRDAKNSPWSEGWEPPTPPADGKWVVRATFSKPGTYVLRCQAHDGGLATSEDVTFVVTQTMTQASKP